MLNAQAESPKPRAQSPEAKRYAMTSKTMTAAMLLMAAHAAFAQQPPRPNETPRAVTLTLAEYNRLIDLAARPPQAQTAAPVAAVLARSDLRGRVDRHNGRGGVNVNGDAVRRGGSRVNPNSGAAMID